MDTLNFDSLLQVSIIWSSAWMQSLPVIPTYPMFFEENVLSALRLTFGNGVRLRKDALSISGWTMDIELLLDDKGKVISPPENTVDPTTHLQLARVAYLCYQHGIHPRKLTSDVRTKLTPLLSSLPKMLNCCRQLAHDWMLDGSFTSSSKEDCNWSWWPTSLYMQQQPSSGHNSVEEKATGSGGMGNHTGQSTPFLTHKTQDSITSYQYVYLSLPSL